MKISKLKKSDFYWYGLPAAVITSILLLCSICSGAEVDTTKAVIHHTASPDWPVERFREIHIKERGWKDVGYHYIIRADGTIENGRPLYKAGAHAKGRNNYVGIALTGYDAFTPEQISSLISLCKRTGIIHIEPHHENCPGTGIDIEEIRRKIK